MYYTKFLDLSIDTNILALNSNNHTRRKYIRSIIPDELLYELYHTKSFSANHISNLILKKIPQLRICPGNIIKRLRRVFGETRTIKEANSYESVLSSRKSTMQDRYSVSHPSQIPAIKERKRQQCLTKYGVDNNFKAKEIKQQIKQFWQQTHGVDSVSQTGINQKRFCFTKPHKKVSAILSKHNIQHFLEVCKPFGAFNPIYERKFYPRVDIFLQQYNLVIEVNGVYWHADPRVYKPDDLFTTFLGKQTASQIWQKDKIKLEHLKTLGYNVEVIWDNEITEDHVLQIIQKYENSKNNKNTTNI